MYTPSSTDDRSGFPVELIRYSSQVENLKAQVRSRDKAAKTKSYDLGYAAILMPLNERDTKALLALFEREDIEQIEAEIDRNLFWLTPAPCWEDNPFDFLSEFL
jgi:hypothetical protein